MHLYAFSVNSNEDNDALLTAVEALRRSTGWSQREIAQAIGASQGHVSKIFRKSIKISSKLSARLSALVEQKANGKLELSALERDALEAIRTSPSFRDLVSAALKMHNNA
jgi:transcriptional regulator with XRE-family HTH domain